MSLRYHHHAPSGWVNDPYGLTWHDGRYHLFFQQVPGSQLWRSDCHWGHASSTDLLTWEPEPVALTPAPGEGCWSGSVAVGDKGPVAFWTAVREPRLDHGEVRRAVPVADDWSAWRTDATVVTRPPEATHFRDPFVHPFEGGWRMLVGAAAEGEVAAVWSYRSDDLRTWTPDGVLDSRPASATDPWTGAGWECPQWVEVDGRGVLLVSVWEPDRLHHVAYRVEDGPWQQLTHGLHYAGSVCHLADGRPALVTWIRDVTGGSGDGAWAGAHSVPVALRLDGDRLVPEPPSGVPLEEHPDGLALRDGDLLEVWGPTGLRAELSRRDTRSSGSPQG